MDTGGVGMYAQRNPSGGAGAGTGAGAGQDGLRLLLAGRMEESWRSMIPGASGTNQFRHGSQPLGPNKPVSQGET